MLDLVPTSRPRMYLPERCASDEPVTYLDVGLLTWRLGPPWQEGRSDVSRLMRSLRRSHYFLFICRWTGHYSEKHDFTFNTVQLLELRNNILVIYYNLWFYRFSRGWEFCWLGHFFCVCWWNSKILLMFHRKFENVHNHAVCVKFKLVGDADMTDNPRLAEKLTT